MFLQTASDERQAQFSPDGHWVAYTSNESGSFEIYVRPFPGPGGQRQVTSTGGMQPRWRADGTELYYIDTSGVLLAIPIRTQSSTLEARTSTRLFQTRIHEGGKGISRHQYDVSRDGLFLLNVTAEDVASAPITVMLNWKPE